MVSKSLLEVITVVKKFPNTVKLDSASWFDRVTHEIVLGLGMSQAARVATRTCLALGVRHACPCWSGPRNTCVSMLLRRATTLCVEDPSLFDLTKAMVDPKPNAEFSLSVISACEVCTGELPCSRRLHVSAQVDNMCDLSHSEIDGGAGANVYVFETLLCPVLSKTKLFTKWLHFVFP